MFHATQFCGRIGFGNARDFCHPAIEVMIQVQVDQCLIYFVMLRNDIGVVLSVVYCIPGRPVSAVHLLIHGTFIDWTGALFSAVFTPVERDCDIQRNLAAPGGKSGLTIVPGPGLPQVDYNFPCKIFPVFRIPEVRNDRS